MGTRGFEIQALVVKNHEAGRGKYYMFIDIFNILRAITWIVCRHVYVNGQHIYLNIGTLCDEDLDGIKQWTFNLTVEEEDLLTESGKAELYKIGQHVKKRLPTIFADGYNHDSMKVRILSYDYPLIAS